MDGKDAIALRAGPPPLRPAAVLVVSFVFALSLTGCGGKGPAPVQAEVEVAPDLDIPGLSADQGRAVAEFGYPDHFFITIDPVGSDRIERWVYFSLGKALDFDNGRLSGEEPQEDESALYPPTDLRPQDFTATMTPAEASQLLGEPLYSHQVRDSLLPENTILVFEKAVLLYRDEQLIGVDTQVRPPKLSPP